jgi:hypothetical protein
MGCQWLPRISVAGVRGASNPVSTRCNRPSWRAFRISHVGSTASPAPASTASRTQTLKKNAGVDDKRLESDIKRDVEGELRRDPERGRWRCRRCGAERAARFRAGRRT